MKLLEIMQLATATITLVAVIWHIAEMKSQIIKYTDTVVASLHNRIYDNDKKFEVFVTRFEERKEFVNYQLHGLDEKLNHKFQRLMDEIQTLKLEIKDLKRNEDSN